MQEHIQVGKAPGESSHRGDVFPECSARGRQRFQSHFRALPGWGGDAWPDLCGPVLSRGRIGTVCRSQY
jgi:hypothetical protein